MRRKIWKCDFEDCNEFAQWYRVQKGQLVKLCTKHEAYLAKKHWGKHIDPSELDEDDIHYLEEKDYKEELAKEKPFEVLLFPLEDGWKVRIRDRRTNEWRSLMVKGTDERRRFSETYGYLKIKGSISELSIDDYVKKLKDNISGPA